MKLFDVIIVGAGIAGVSVASELARTCSVCLVEAESQPGIHATGRSAALFLPTYGGREIRALTRASRAFFDKPWPGFTDHPLLRPRGCLYIATDDQLDRLEGMVQSIVASGGRAARIGASQALARVPLLRSGYVADAALDPEAMDIDVDALHRGLLRAARAAGAVLMTDCSVLSIERVGGQWRLTSGQETLEAPLLVNAAGAWADEVGAACGARPMGLQPLLRTAFLIDPPSDVSISEWPAVIDVDEQFYFKPDAGKLLLSPADETPAPPCDAHPDELDIAIGVDRVQAALDIDVRRVSHSWAGLRTFAPDRVPVVGFDPEVEGLFWCAGQGGYGIQTAPAMGRTAAALVLGEHLPADIADEGLVAAALAPARFRERASATAQ